MYVQVSFPISSFNSFTYSVPKGLIKKISLGVCINAPIKNKLQSGFIIDINKKPLFSGKILPIHSIHDKSYHLPDELWKTIKWLSKYYVVPIGKVLKAAIPNTVLNQYSPQTIKYALITKKGVKKFLENDHKKPAHQKVLSYLFNNKLIKIKKLKDIVSSPYSICKKLEENGFIKIFLQPKITNPYNNINPNKIKNIVLSKEQKKIFNEIIKFKKEKKPFLIHGVTGSGKTEIYMKLAQTIIKQGNSVLVLVPEIALTPQITQRFYSAFGNKIALWHSQMTKAEKGWSWKKINSGEYPIIIGARSAIFAPIKNLGLIIVDEEQESSFKQENPNPRYNARDVAIIRAKYSHSMILLASATPSLESYYNSLQKKFILLKLSKRYGESIYPKIELVDMKKQNDKSSIISKQLINAIDDCLNKSEQIILLQNRRGYSSIQQCNQCGQINTCKNCAVAMTYHKTDNYMHCHYCEKINTISLLCSHCNNDSMEFKGTGTQRVEKIISNLFPNIKILRMDVDTVRKKDGHKKILNEFSKKGGDILLGTQMIAKGLDFDNVTLVGVINADSGLFFPDFRSGEKVFQLIYQVSGRSGRRKKQGRAIIQTYNPDDIYIKTASSLNTKQFYNIAMAQRQELNYPPFSRIGRIILKGINKNSVNELSKKIFNKLKPNEHFQILGPSPAPIEKIRGLWRFHIIIKSINKKNDTISKFIFENIGFSIFEKKINGIQIILDVDPISMM